MRTTSWGRHLAAAIATMAVVLACATAASAVSINGFGYQGLGPYSEVGEFYEKGIGLPYARAIIAYDSADNPSTMADIHQWVQRVQSRGRQVLISFNHNDSAPPNATTYGQRIRTFRDWMIDHGSPISEFTAWNEPNHPAENDTTRVRLNPSAANQAALAAQYWTRLNALCQIAVNGQRCTAIAGDFHDPNPTIAGHISFFNTYVADYTAALGATPAKWAIHPYSAIANKNFSVVERWINTSTGSADVWLTELGAKFCREDWGFENLAGTPGDATTAAGYQNDRADGLKRSLAGLPSRVTRAYYYTLSAPAASGHTHCDVQPRWDTQLLGDQYGYGSAERPAFRTLFPSAPMAVPPTVATSPASGVDAYSATLNGTVNPNGLNTTYRFEYGPTTAYGSSIPVSDESVGAGSASISVSRTVKLRPVTSYHYRLVATNAIAQSATTDATFTTPAVDDQPAAVRGFNGTGASTFARDNEGAIRVTTWTGTRNTPWTSLGGRAVSGPAAARRADGTVDVFALWADGAFYHKTISPLGVESAWVSIGGNFVSAPAVSVRRGYGGYIDVVGRNADNSIYLRTFDPTLGTWSAWNSMGGAFRSAPAVTSWYDGGVDVVARGTDNVIYRNYWIDRSDTNPIGRWSGWQSIGGNADSGPTAVSFYPGNLEFFYRGSNNALYRKTWGNGRWLGDWAYTSANIDSAPQAISELDGQLALFARTGNTIIQMKFENGSWWRDWGTLGNPSLRFGGQ